MYYPLNYNQATWVRGHFAPSSVKTLNTASYDYWERSLWQRLSSVIDFKLKVKIPSGFLRFLIYALVFIFGSALMGVVSSVLIVIGILDASHNFRGIEEC